MQKILWSFYGSGDFVLSFIAAKKTKHKKIKLAHRRAKTAVNLACANLSLAAGLVKKTVLLLYFRGKSVFFLSQSGIFCDFFARDIEKKLAKKV
jgi:hypothetical protein